MASLVQFTAPQLVELVECPAQTLPPGHFRVRTWYSGISAGTELTAYNGSNPYLTRTWDPGRRLFVRGEPTFAYPVRGWGYSEVGEVVEVADGVEAVRPGQVVAGIWGHRSDGVVPANAVTWLPIPAGMAPLHGIFTRVGAIALNAVLAAETRLGDVLAVFGQGVIGLLATHYAQMSGCTVIAVDGIEGRRKAAADMGAQHVLAPNAGTALTIRELTAGRGADVAIDLSGSYHGLREAVRAVGPDSTVVAAGFYQGAATPLHLGEEFHHNRVRIIASQIGSIPPRLHPRWDRERLQQTVAGLLAQGKPDVLRLISHRYPLAAASAAYELIDQHADQALQVILEFS